MMAFGTKEPACRPSGPPTWREAYTSLAGQAPLAGTLSLAAALASQAWPEAALIVFELQAGRLVAHPAPGRAGSLAAAMDSLPAGSAPWWEACHELCAVRRSDGWAPLVAGLPGVEWCWSLRILTPAGEVVGTLTALLPASSAPPPVMTPERLAALEEAAEFAALAIEQSHFVEELTYQARHDMVTGLWTRHHFEQVFQEWRNRSRRGAAAAFLLIDLDGFLRIREILGGETADDLVSQAASRLRAVLRGGDMAARSGEGEFHVLLPNVSGGVEMESVAARIQAEMRRPFLVRGHEINISCSIGMCPVAAGGEEKECMIRRARAALARAHQFGRGRMAVFDPSLTLLTPERLELERRLRRAPTQGEFRLHYQPQVRVADSSLSGVEALLRWHDPDIGLVAPGAFIPIAEETGLIIETGAWVLAHALRQTKLWADQGRPRRVGINVSAVQFAAPGFAAQVEAALEFSGANPALVELELTESTLLGDRDSAISSMHRLRERGVEFALDDFGTGHSSLAYLRELPVQRLKIDRGFLGELETRPDLPLLASIVNMAHGLGLPVIAEGVETAAQWEAAARVGCDEVQGFYVARPMPPASLEDWLAN
jgi:diguanylate cyclase (GGDEF)-like protein